MTPSSIPAIAVSSTSAAYRQSRFPQGAQALHRKAAARRRFAVQARATALAIGASALLFGGASSQAASDTWIGNTSSNWNAGINWSGAVAPVNGDTLIFGIPGAAGISLTDNISALTVGGSNTDGIDFGANADAYIIAPSSATLTLASSGTGIGIKDLSLNAQTLSVPLALSSSQAINVSQSNGSLTLGGVISGTGFGPSKAGSGLLTLSGANTFTGGLTLSGGTTNLSNFAGSGTNGGNGTIIFDGGALRYSGGGNVSSNVFVINAGKTATFDTGNGSGGAGSGFIFSGVIASTTGGFTKTGFGQLQFNGANAYTGTTTINQGTLYLDRNGGGSINSASALIMGGQNTSLATVSQNINAPTLLIQADSNSSSNQTFAGLTLNQGSSQIGFRSIGAVDMLALGTITHNGGGLINFSRLKDVSGSANALITTSNTNTNGILGGWATTNPDAVLGGASVQTATDWATVSGGAIVAYSGYTTPTGATPTLANDATSNVRLDTTSTGNVSLTFASNVSDLNTIQMTDTNARTIAIGSGNTLRLGSYGGVWKTQGNGSALTIGVNGATAGTLTAGGAANTPGEIVFNGNATNTSTSSIVVNSVIANNGSGAVSVTKTGQGSLDLYGANTFTGNTYLNQGRLVTQNVAALGGNGTTAGSGAVFIEPGGQLFLGAGGTYVNSIEVAGNGTSENGNFGALRVGNNVQTIGTSTSTITLRGDTRFGRSGDNGSIATLAGKLTGNYNLELISNGTGTEVNRNVYILTNIGNDMGATLASTP